MKYLKNYIIILSIIIISTGILFSNNVRNRSHKKVLNKRIKKCNKIFKQGKKYFLKHDYKNAEKKFQKSLEILKSHTASHFFMSQIFYKQKKYDKAISSIKSAKESCNLLTTDNMLALKGRISGLNGKIHTLNTSVVGLASINCAGKAEADIINKSIYNKKQIIKGYEQQLEKLSNNIVPIPSEYYYFHGNILFKQNQFDKAKSQYKKAIKADSLNKQAYNNLIYICLLQKNFKDAHKYLKNALDFEVKINEKLINAVDKNFNTDNKLLYKDYIEKIDNMKRIILKLNFKKEEFYENCYVVFDNQSGDAVIIDPGIRDERIEGFIKKKNLLVKAILNTHGHFDHIKGNRYYSDLYKVKIYGHIKDMKCYSNENKNNSPTYFIEKEGLITFGTLKIRIFHTPGHTLGSVCFLINKYLFSGDTLFKGRIGKVFEKSVLQKKNQTNNLIKNIKSKLMVLDANTILFPGHGNHSTIGFEKKNNTYLK